MRLSYILPVILFFPLLLIQVTVVPLFSLNGSVPDLLLIILVYYTLQHGQIYGTVLGFIFGFLFDLITGGLIGSAMISKTIAGFTAGYFSKETQRDQYLRSFLFCLIVLLCASVDSIIYSFFSSIDLSSNVLLLLFQQGLMPALYTSIISTILLLFSPRGGIR